MAGMSPDQFAALLNSAAIRVKDELVIPTEKLMVALEEQSKGYLGHYQDGWARLQPETIARKATGDSPLLETGALRDGISHRSEPTPEGAIGEFGSNDPKASYLELGTSRGLSPRPFISLSADHAAEPIAEIFGEFARSIFGK
jgi:hypothetical protein